MSSVEEVLVDLLKAYSPTGHEERARMVLVDIADRLGLKAEVDEVGNVLVRKGGGGNVWLIGHYDTVPGELPVKWRNGIITGRGAVDAKGPLSAMLVAASLSRHPVTVAALVGEEGDSRGARYLLKEKLPPYIIIGEPSNTTGVIIAYRGGAHLKILCKGRGGHSSSPGESAIDKMIDFILELRKLAPGTRYGEPRGVITIIEGGEAPNVLPKRASATIDLRVPPGMKPEELIHEMESKLAKGCYIEIGWITPPVVVRPSDPVPRAIVRSLLKLGKKPKLLRKYGSSDMNLLQGKVRSISAYGPGNSRLAHTDEEAISVDELTLAVEVYREALDQLSTH